MFEKDLKDLSNCKEFIDTYEQFYFKEIYHKKEKSELKNNLGIKGVKTTPIKDEKLIVKKLKNGINDVDTIAWKLGTYHQGNHVDGCIINSNYGQFDLKGYLKNIDKKNSEIKKLLNSATELIKKRKYYYAIPALVEAYNILECEAPDRFGAVYIINSMFFLSKGEIPIYDKKVYIAIQALYFAKRPKDTIVSDAPRRNDPISAIMRLLGYMRMLDEVFGDNKKLPSELPDDYQCESVGFISRGLDRALWVYGQTTK